MSHLYAVVFISAVLVASSWGFGFSLPEGSSCFTKDFKVGVCVKSYQCGAILDRYKRPKDFKLCSHQDNTKIICCDSCNRGNGTDIRNSVEMPSKAVMWKNGNKAWDQCLEYSKYARGRCPDLFEYRGRWNGDCAEMANEQKQGIVGGKSSARYEYPYMALLGYGDQPDVFWECGGSLVSEWFVLTAAHCTFNTIRRENLTHVALGILKRSDPQSTWKIHEVDSIFNHPQYEWKTYHDIALVKTRTKVKLDWSVHPICLLPIDPKVRSDAVYSVAGWGSTGNGTTLADNLQSVIIEEFRSEECSKQYRPHRLMLNGFDNSTQMCCGRRSESADTCQGDSGGPLLRKDPTLCMDVIAGITSKGKECGSVGQGGLYTRVESYLDWITDIVWP